MKYPKLLLKNILNTQFQLTVKDNEMNENGTYGNIASITGLCYYTEKNVKVIKNDELIYTRVGVLYVDKNVIGDLDLRDGEITIDGKNHKIKGVTKARDLDGSVNFVKIEVTQ